MLSREKLIELINEAKLPDYTDRILASTQPAIHLRLTRRADDDDVAIGQSRAGGAPDLPSGTEWPSWNDKPLTFMLQLRLSDIAPFDSQHHLPSQGMLYFFYEVDEQPWGFDPADRGAGKVVFVENETTTLVRKEHPTTPGKYDEIHPFPACRVEFSESLLIPPDEHPAFIATELEKDKRAKRKYRKLRGLIDDFTVPKHHLLGYPDQIQGEMRWECQMVSHGLKIGGKNWRKDPRLKELEPGIPDWRLLLQIDTDEGNLDMMWGDLGTLFYWIQQPALQAKDFTNCWVVLQCY